MPKANSTFTRFAKWAARASGRPAAFVMAFGVILLWALVGPVFKWSDTWQLVINTSTTIITFLMVFLIQNTQNRDAAAVQLKLDEIVRSVVTANNAVLDFEELDDDELERIRAEYEKLAETARKKIQAKQAKAGKKTASAR
ncbi:MAG TPA: low affinity iron permease family protein [Thermoanaerobaculia bacterium]|nr:low affinity iron permease family protein [Thermoanaerobaculia bacterium]